MPVRKLRGLDEATPRPERSAAENLRAAFELSELCAWLAGTEPARGIRRHRSLRGHTEGGTLQG